MNLVRLNLLCQPILCAVFLCHGSAQETGVTVEELSQVWGEASDLRLPEWAQVTRSADSYLDQRLSESQIYTDAGPAVMNSDVSWKWIFNSAKRLGSEGFEKLDLLIVGGETPSVDVAMQVEIPVVDRLLARTLNDEFIFTRSFSSATKTAIDLHEISNWRSGFYTALNAFSFSSEYGDINDQGAFVPTIDRDRKSLVDIAKNGIPIQIGSSQSTEGNTISVLLAPDFSGFKGIRTSGADGLAGQWGETGSAGQNGSVGADGATGFSGSNGFGGSDGDGEMGDGGQPGDSGGSGSDGSQGEPGVDGMNGVDGSPGEHAPHLTVQIEPVSSDFYSHPLVAINISDEGGTFSEFFLTPLTDPFTIVATGGNGGDGGDGGSGGPGGDGGNGGNGGHGQDGGAGGDGGDGKMGSSGGDGGVGGSGGHGGHGGYGGVGGAGGNGGTGGNGANGGDGAVVTVVFLGGDDVFRSRVRDGIQFNLEGGLGGAPGAAGLGGSGGLGGAAGSGGSAGSGGTGGDGGRGQSNPNLPDAPSVSNGSDGSDGEDGSPGNDGLPGVDGDAGVDGQPGKPGSPGLPGRVVWNEAF